MQNKEGWTDISQSSSIRDAFTVIAVLSIVDVKWMIYLMESTSVRLMRWKRTRPFYIHLLCNRMEETNDMKRICFTPTLPRRPTMVYGKVKEVNKRMHSEESSDYDVVIRMTVYTPGQKAYLDSSVEKTEETEDFEVILQDEWKTTVVQPDDRINVVLFTPSNSPNSTCVSNKNNNFVIVFPDTLFTATSIASSYCCLRRSLLSNFIRSYQESKYSLFGRIRHDLFEVRAWRSVHGSIHPR